jgi:hypothetical protein
VAGRLTRAPDEAEIRGPVEKHIEASFVLELNLFEVKSSFLKPGSKGKVTLRTADYWLSEEPRTSLRKMVSLPLDFGSK